MLLSPFPDCKTPNSPPHSVCVLPLLCLGLYLPLNGYRYLNRVLVPLPESVDAQPLALALLVGPVDKIAFLEATHMAPPSLTACLGFRSLMYQLRNEILGILRTFLSYPSTNLRRLLVPFVAERLRYVRHRFPPHHLHLRYRIHQSLSPRRNMLLGTRGHHPEKLAHRLRFVFKACSPRLSDR